MNDDVPYLEDGVVVGIGAVVLGNTHIVRNVAIGAYDALYDFDTGLWTQGPDYFIDFFLKMKRVRQGA